MAGKRTVTVKLSQREYWLLGKALDSAAALEDTRHAIYPGEGYELLASAYRKIYKHIEQYAPRINKA